MERLMRQRCAAKPMLFDNVDVSVYLYRFLAYSLLYLIKIRCICEVTTFINAMTRQTNTLFRLLDSVSSAFRFIILCCSASY